MREPSVASTKSKEPSGAKAGGGLQSVGKSSLVENAYEDAVEVGSSLSPMWEAIDPAEVLSAEQQDLSVAVQRKASDATGMIDDGPRAHEMAESGVRGATSEFPHRRTIEALFGRPITARAALGGAAASACNELGANAYTRGDQVAFVNANPDLHLAAHEAAHTLQQRQGVSLDGGFGRASDGYECVADEAANRVTRGESAADLFGDIGAAFVTPSVDVQMQRHPNSNNGQGWQAVMVALRRVDPVAGARDYTGALRALEALNITDMLHALQEVERMGEFDAFFAAAGATASPQVRVAFRVAQLERNVRAVDRAILDALNQSISSLPPVEQLQVVMHIAQVAGQMGNEIFDEGIAATLQTATMPMAAAAASAPTPVGPGSWSPPGNQPIPFYIGNEAHVAIALRYVAAHAGQQVFTNSVPFSTILGRMPGARPSAVGASDLALRPDIANVTLRQIYEIKPATQVADAQAKLNLYLGIFQTAGVPMNPGAQTEPGAAGIVEAPGGYYIYECPVPGIILYQYHRGQYVPTSVPVPQQQQAPQPARNGFWHHMQQVTGFTGAALVIYVIVSEGSRVAFPLRNLIPAP